MKRLVLLTVLGALVSGTAGATTVTTAFCPFEMPARHHGCYDAASDAIYVNPGLFSANRRAVVLHEWGHVFDHQRLDDGERAGISKRLGWLTWRPEQFADRFAACHLNERMRHRAFPFSPWSRDAKFCALVRRARSTA